MHSWATEVEKEHEDTGWDDWQQVSADKKKAKKKKHPEGQKCNSIFASPFCAPPPASAPSSVSSSVPPPAPIPSPTPASAPAGARACAWKSTGTNSLMTKLLPSERWRGEGGGGGGGGGGTGGGTLQSKSNLEHRNAIYIPDEHGPLLADSDCSDIDLEDDSDSDGWDSDASVKSLETRKKNKWFRSFFQTLDSYTNEQLNDFERQWHCPACQGGKGAIDWYKGLQPLITHAKTHRKRRIKLHKEFAEVLEEDLEMRQAGRGYIEAKFGKWKGLREDNEVMNPLIVWPPMVIIQNTRLDQDEQEKWTGMGNKELLDMFKDYSPMKARHSYGPRGHRGMSLIVFAGSPTGYLNAERLAKNFKDLNRGKENWEHPGKLIFNPGGDRILYGYMATAEEMEVFNRHSSGKSKVKWELQRYQEAVVHSMRQMDMENKDLHKMKVRVAKEKENIKSLVKTVNVFTRKLELREKEIVVIRHMAKEQHEENQKEMDELEQTYKERIRQLSRDTARREEEIQKQQDDFHLEQMERCQELEKKPGENHQQAKMEEEIVKIVESSYRDSEDYEVQKRELMKKQHLRKFKFMRDQYEQALLFEKELEKERSELLDKYNLQREQASVKSTNCEGIGDTF